MIFQAEEAWLIGEDLSRRRKAAEQTNTKKYDIH